MPSQAGLRITPWSSGPPKACCYPCGCSSTPSYEVQWGSARHPRRCGEEVDQVPVVILDGHSSLCFAEGNREHKPTNELPLHRALVRAHVEQVPDAGPDVGPPSLIRRWVDGAKHLEVACHSQIISAIKLLPQSMIQLLLAKKLGCSEVHHGPALRSGNLQFICLWDEMCCLRCWF